MTATTTRGRLQQKLSQVDFPAGKDDLVAAALARGADEETVRALRGIPPVDYGSFAEVLASVTVIDEPEGRAGEGERAATRRTHTTPGLSETNKDVPQASPITEELGENRRS